MLNTRRPSIERRRRAGSGQVLVLFALFLLVLLGISALAIDYASWLVVDRNLQNTADHAALAGASAFGTRTSQGSCSGGSGQVKCEASRAQAWTSINADLGLGLSPAAITQLSLSDSPANGTTTVTAGGTTYAWQDRVWVATPPPTYAAYTTPSIGGKYAHNFGVVFARVDHDVRSLVGGVLGIQPQPRHGWATAGALPTGFALQTFCRNNIAPQGGVCENSAGLTIDGSGVKIVLVRGDIASNESLTVTSNNTTGVVVQSGDVFLVNRTCSSSTWNCPQAPAVAGGIADDDPTNVPNTANNKNAFYMAPLPVPQFASPLGNGATPLADTTTKASDCTGASATSLCVPYRPLGAVAPGDWACTNSAIIDPCGTPVFDSVNGTVRCNARLGGTPDNHLDPTVGGANFNNVAGNPNQNNGNEWNNIDDDYSLPDPDTTLTPANPPQSWIYTDNFDHKNNPPISTLNASVTFNLKPPFGTPTPGGTTTVRYVGFKTNTGTIDGSGYPITLQATLLQGGVAISSDPTLRTLGGTPTRYEWTVGANVITNYNNLSLRFTFESANQSNNNAMERGGGVSWAEAETPALLPPTALPPMIPPGYYHSMTIEAGGCAVLDPTAVYSHLYGYQMPGIYRFQGNGSAKIDIGDGGALIGDGVTFVFDSGFPSATGGKGLIIGNNAVLALNTATNAGSQVCGLANADGADYNPSAPLFSGTAAHALPASSLCAAWGVDTTATAVFHPGQSQWPSCDPVNEPNPQCVDRSQYNPATNYRGVTFYFTPNAWPGTNIEQRFQMGGTGGSTPGIAFRGVLYAPYDDVKMSGGCNGFKTIGQVLAWTAKFNGGCAYIQLDYPYRDEPADPYLLEPTVNQ